MPARLTFFAIAAFWLTMNALLWHEEIGAHAGETPVPIALVWHKILTAPDSSSLSVYQDRERMGYCEISSSVGQEMSTVDVDRPPPEGLVKRAGYQIHVGGNVGVGEFTNRIKFDGHLQFSSARAWRELNLKITTRQVVVEIHSLATNQIVHLKITGGGSKAECDVTFAELQNPNALLHAVSGNMADSFFGMMDLPNLSATESAQKLEWRASRTRVKLGSELVPIYRIETSALGRSVVVDISTLGEILRVDLPGNISARIDEFGKP